MLNWHNLLLYEHELQLEHWSNASGLYLGGAQFKFRLIYWLSWRVSCGIPQSLQADAGKNC
jgi:hypothetical protein